MGRARGKLTIKQIEAERARRLAFNQRSNGLAKKVSEFSRKFGVEACLIVYDGYGDGRPLTWPQNSIAVESILEKYKQQKIEGTTPKEFDVKDYFANKIKKAEAEISKVQKDMVMNMYPTWHPYFKSLEGEQLNTFIGIIDGKIQACNKRISMLKKMQQSDETSFTQNTAAVSLPPVLKWDDVMAEPGEWTCQLGEHEELINFSNHVDVQHSETSFTQNTADPLNYPVLSTGTNQFGEMDFTNHVDMQQSETSFTQNTAHTQSMAQEIFYPSNSNQFDVMHDGFSQRQHISDPLKAPASLPPVSAVEFKDLTAEPGEWDDQEWFTDTELLNLDDRAASKLDDGDGIMKWSSQDDGDELLKLISQDDDVFAWKDDSFLKEGMSNISDFGRTDKTLFQ